jgi:hypothetical protein
MLIHLMNTVNTVNYTKMEIPTQPKIKEIDQGSNL